jgi:hypothetical protein
MQQCNTPNHSLKVETPLEKKILKNEGDAEQLAPLLADADILSVTSGVPAARRRYGRATVGRGGT